MGMHFKLGLYEHQSAGALQGLVDLLIKHPEIEAAYCGAVTSSDLSSSDGESEDTDARLEAAVTLKDNSTLSSGTPAGIKMAACPV